MNAKQRLIEATGLLLDAMRRYQMDVDDSPSLDHRRVMGYAEAALAAANEEQGKVLTVEEIDALCDAYDNYVKNRYPDQWPELSAGFEAGVRAVADSGYLAPAKGSGLTVEQVMEVAEQVQNMPPLFDPPKSKISLFRKALEDLAGKE